MDDVPLPEDIKTLKYIAPAFKKAPFGVYFPSEKAEYPSKVFAKPFFAEDQLDLIRRLHTLLGKLYIIGENVAGISDKIHFLESVAPFAHSLHFLQGDDTDEAETLRKELELIGENATPPADISITTTNFVLATAASIAESKPKPMAKRKPVLDDDLDDDLDGLDELDELNELDELDEDYVPGMRKTSGSKSASKVVDEDDELDEDAIDIDDLDGIQDDFDDTMDDDLF
jgi:hypothetical protein